ncbi:hypothetical protein [Cetobacterium sp.]|uniref:hypothetical protein n=1 Tax=Cetobacterium sp. TaxID=2071632 RepID=UPI003F37D0DE
MDTIIVPSKPEGLNYFLREKNWENIRILEKKISEIKYIALYQSSPISKITHYGVVKNIEKYKSHSYRGTYKYRIYFSIISRPLDIRLDDPLNRKLIIQSPRYTSLEKLLKVNTISELLK